jgi:5'-methylthioinosine phosphorylase
VSAWGLIGGTGLDELAGFAHYASHDLETPFGHPSAPILEGHIGASRVCFLPRHGRSHHIPPHRINYRANLWALRALGVDGVIAVNAVGGITEFMRPGCVVFPDQIIDYTWGREHTFDEGGDQPLQHVDFTEPYDRALRLRLLQVADEIRLPHIESATYGAAQGPRLESAAEIRRMRQDGCDIVGMTGMPEAALAREAGLAYAAVCMVVNPAAGIGEVPISMESIQQILEKESSAVRRLLVAFFDLGGL